MERRVVDLRVDYPALAAMQRVSWEINFPGEPFVESAFRHALERSEPSGDVLVYEQSGEIVGWLWLDWRVGRERAHIRHLQVAQPYWGRGYGRYLVQDAFQLARQKGRREITLNVTKSNQRAMRLYAGNGFVARQDMGDRLHMWCALEPEPEAANH
jgi:ribosomal protein S18 acetylase RimI-like enzyme